MNAAAKEPKTSNPKRAIVLALIVLAVIGIGIAFFIQRQRGDQQPKVVHLGSFSVAVDYAPYLIAKRKGWFDEAMKAKGYSVEYATFQSLPPINESLATGRLDGFVAAEPPVIVGNAAGISSRIVAISCSLVQEILVPTKSIINAPGDLKGKKVAVLAGTSSHYGLFKTIEAAGLAHSDIEVIDMVPPDAKNAFETGKVDAWAVWPPFVEQEEIAGTGRVLPSGDAHIQSILAMRGGFVNDHADLVRDLVKVMATTKQWMVAHEDEAIQLVAQELQIPIAVVKKAWPEHNWKAELTPQVTADIQAKADFLFKEKFIRVPVDASKLVDSSFQAQQ